jgi:hypothetical protein
VLLKQGGTMAFSRDSEGSASVDLIFPLEFKPTEAHPCRDFASQGVL